MTYNGHVNFVAENLRRIHVSLGTTRAATRKFIEEADTQIEEFGTQIKILERQNEQERLLIAAASTELTKLGSIELDDPERTEDEVVDVAVDNLIMINSSVRDSIAKLDEYISVCEAKIEDRNDFIQTLRGQAADTNRLKVKAQGHLEVLDELDLPNPSEEKTAIDLRSPFSPILRWLDQPLYRLKRVNLRDIPLPRLPREHREEKELENERI